VTVVPATGLDLALTYRLGAEFSEKAAVGSRVLIPLGRRVVTGFIIAGGGAYSGEIRDVIDLLDSDPLFDDGTFRFFRFSGRLLRSPARRGNQEGASERIYDPDAANRTSGRRILCR